jgi:predicted aspartyl protease
VKSLSFEWSGDLMVVEAALWGTHKAREILLVIDTGASMTSVEPAILQELGYTSDDAILRTRVPTPVGVQHGHLLRTPRFHALGVDLSGFVVQALALADAYGVDGLLGMNFLERFNFTIRPRDRQILLEPAELGEPPRAA